MDKMWSLILSIVFFSTVPTVNAEKPWNYSDWERAQNEFKYDARIEVRFSNYDREVIQHYYRHGKKKGLPPGLAKKEKLPPGLQKQIVRNGRLPPGLQARYLPYELVRGLDRLPRNYVRLRVGSDIVLMDISTRVILDVVKDIGF